MNRLKMLVGALALGVALSSAATAQPVPEGVFVNAQQQSQYLARDLLLGAKVYGPGDKIIGDVEDLIMNEDNQIVGVVMGVGGFLGVGEKKVGVQYRALTFSTEGEKVKVSLPEGTQEVLKAVPAFQRAAPQKSLLDRAIDKARELRDKSAVTGQDAYNKAKEAAGPAYEKAKEATVQAYEKAKEAAGQAYDKAKEAATPAPKPAQ